METAKGKTREEIINRLADRIDSFEKYNQPHSRLMAALALHLGKRFGLAAADIDAIVEAAMLHDIGLYAMSPSYHAVPHPLAFEARLDLWRHPVIGEQQMAKRDAMRHAQLLVRWHHEWWNGSGYPDMLAFENIPIGARILRAVELYCALICERPYREALTEQQALEALTSSAGVECDPYVVKALLALLEEFGSDIDESEGVRAAEALASQSSPHYASPVSESPAEHAEDEPLAHVLPAPESSMVFADSVSGGSDQVSDASGFRSEPGSEPASEGNEAIATSATHFRAIDAEPIGARDQQSPPASTAVTELTVQQPPRDLEPPRSVPRIELLLSHAQSPNVTRPESPAWRNWIGSRSNKKTLLGFQASVLRQIEFRSIAIPTLNEARLDLYLKTWGKLIFANDPRAWAGTVARATVEATEPLGEDIITRILEDVYVPGSRLANPDLRRWFGEIDSWWMDNLRRNIDRLDDQLMQAQALNLGLQTGDYALSFNDESRELRRPLTTVFWRLAGRAFLTPGAQPHNRSFNQPVEEFIKHARADLLLLSAPSSQMDRGVAEERSSWRESWVSGATDGFDKANHVIASQSRQSYLASIDRLLRPASHFRTWAIEYQEPGLAGVQDLVDLIKEHRPVKATYSKDVTEVAGGLRSYIIVGEKPTR